MNKKIIYIIISIVCVATIVFTFIYISKPSKPKSIFSNTIPFINKSQNISAGTTPTIFRGEGIPPQTNYKKVSTQITNEVSQIEKSKIIDFLPIRIENFQTSTTIATTINIFTLPSDPPQSIRIEIYGPNFNNANVNGPDAIAFKNSFLEIKKTFDQRKMNLNNLQIIYGNRQYIQDTATVWVKQFNLLD